MFILTLWEDAIYDVTHYICYFCKVQQSEQNVVQKEIGRSEIGQNLSDVKKKR